MEPFCRSLMIDKRGISSSRDLNFIVRPSAKGCQSLMSFLNVENLMTC